MTANRRRQLCLWVLSLGLGYAVFGFFIAPRILKAVVVWQLPKQTGRQVALQKIRLNPFTMSIAVDGFVIREPDGKPFVAWDEVFVNADPTGLLSHQLVLSQIAVSNAFGHVQVNRDGSFNFSDIVGRVTSRGAASGDAAYKKPLTIRIGTLHIAGSHVVYDDLTRATPFATTVGPIDVTLRAFSTNPDNKNPYGFTAVTESGEKLSWRGYFYLGPIRSEGEFAIENIMLKKYAPFYDDLVNLTLHDGLLDVRSSYRVEFSDRLSVAQLSNAVIKLTALKIAEHNATNNVIELAGMTVNGIDLDLVAQTVAVDVFTATGGRIAARKLDDGLPNLAKMFMTDKPPAAVATNPVPAKPWQLTVREIRADDHAGTVTGFFGDQTSGCRQFHLTNLRAVSEPLSLAVDDITVDGARLDQLIPAGMTNLFARAGTTNAPAPAKPSAPLPAVHIGSFTVTNGVLNFADESLATPASVTATGLSVTVTGFSTDTNSVTDLHVAARVDNIAPVEVTGHINPFAPDATTTMAVAFKGINLAPVSGYSGKYAGYLIRKGRLSLDLKYDIQQRALKAQNTILVDQFSFGEATDSPDALKLPVKLAVAILKDVNGQIKLDVPVEGRIDDPKFRYWPAVWQVVGTLFTRIFTAPFSMLGSMFGGGGGEELGWQEFAPGAAQLLPEQVKKLDVIVKAMTERPALNVEIEGNVDKEKDLEPLKRRKLDLILRELKAQRSGAVGTPRPTGDVVGRAVPSPPLPGEERLAWLRVAYAEALPQIQSKLAPPPPPEKIVSNVQNFGAKSVAPSKRAKKAAAELSAEEMERNYFEIIEVAPEDYRPLATERANAVREYLLHAGKIEAERVYLADLTKRALPVAGTRAVFSLQ